MDVVLRVDSIRLFVQDDAGNLLPHPIDLAAEDLDRVVTLAQDGEGASARVLAGMWTRWMSAAATSAKATILASTPLEPFAHQSTAVYGAMLPQPRLRFLLADEPGTGKTIMAAMYLREAQKLGLVRRALVVAPANLVSKWQFDFERFFGGELRRITAETVYQHALDIDHDMWIVSLELAAVNANVQQAIRADQAGWDIVVFDEAHRLTPTAQTFYSVGRLLAKGSPRALLMTATPHRGSEWMFRHLLHLVDPDIYPDPGDDPKADLLPLKPGAVHFLRRMKDELVDRDGVTPLFKKRHATNVRIPLSAVEDATYLRALELVDEFFPPSAQPLARMVYGKRAASTLYALAETLERRRDHMGEKSVTEAEAEADPYGEDEAARDEAKVIASDSLSARKERRAIDDLLGRVRSLLDGGRYEPSKWFSLVKLCLAENGIHAGNDQQAVMFTEYADSAAWVAKRLIDDGCSARVYSGHQPTVVREEVRSGFMRGEFQVIVSTDAGNEGIDLQSAHVLVNYDIPWSLVRLEQRMGRIHRIGQSQDVELYNLVAVGTREGEALHTLLDRFVVAANDLDGQLFDSLSLVGEMAGVHYEEWLTSFYGHDEKRKQEALEAVQKVKAEELKHAARKSRAAEAAIASKVDAMAATALFQQDVLDRVNPAIVEAYLHRLADAGLLTVNATALGKGILLLGPLGDLPRSVEVAGGLVATSGYALREAAASTDTSRVVALGPGEPAFHEITTFADEALGSDVFRGGAAEDPTGIGDYDLYAYEATLTESDGRVATPWTVLVRADDGGNARAVRWEALANLVPCSRSAAPPHPARVNAADQAAREFAADMQERSQKTRLEWFANAKRQLQSLPTNLTKTIANRDARLGMRAKLALQVDTRLSQLEQMSQVTVSIPRLVARLRVFANGIPPTAEEKDSEHIAMLHVRNLLLDAGWQVDDVSSEGRGYDLLAARGGQQRCVEVKGVWGPATNSGIRMTGNEVLIATQQRANYWLYVVDECSDREGTLFGTFPDPVTTFRSDITADAIFKVPGSSLRKARDKEYTYDPHD